MIASRRLLYESVYMEIVYRYTGRFWKGFVYDHRGRPACLPASNTVWTMACMIASRRHCCFLCRDLMIPWLRV
jgi:hypothetical protein